jgi:Plasmid replication region DNA-binding N-term
MPQPLRYGRDRIRAAIADLLAAGRPLAALTKSEIRLRLGGGSWASIAEELDRARARGGPLAPVPPEPSGLPEAVNGQLAQIDRRLEEVRRAGLQLARDAVEAALDAERQRHREEQAKAEATLAEAEGLRAHVAGLERERERLAGRLEEATRTHAGALEQVEARMAGLQAERDRLLGETGRQAQALTDFERRLAEAGARQERVEAELQAERDQREALLRQLTGQGRAARGGARAPAGKKPTRRKVPG